MRMHQHTRNSVKLYSPEMRREFGHKYERSVVNYYVYLTQRDQVNNTTEMP